MLTEGTLFLIALPMLFLSHWFLYCLRLNFLSTKGETLFKTTRINFIKLLYALLTSDSQSMCSKHRSSLLRSILDRFLIFALCKKKIALFSVFKYRKYWKVIRSVCKQIPHLILLYVVKLYQHFCRKNKFY